MTQNPNIDPKSKNRTEGQKSTKNRPNSQELTQNPNIDPKSKNVENTNTTTKITNMIKIQVKCQKVQIKDENDKKVRHERET